MKIAFFGSVVPEGLFRLSGIQNCFIYKQASDFTDKIKELKDFALVIVTHKIANENQRFIDEFRLDYKYPVIIEIADYKEHIEFPEIYDKIRTLLGVELI